MFRSCDRRCYYVLNEMRKTINDNARRLIFILTGLLYVWTFLAVFALKYLIAHAPTALMFDEKMAVTAGVVAAAVLWWFASWAFMHFIQSAFYKQQQQHTTRELRYFLTKYLGRLADRFREVTGNAKQVTVGHETDSIHLAEAAQKWHKIMMWIPFRTFYIECFVRNILYQISRNCGYYLWIPPVSVFVLLAIAVVWFILPFAPVIHIHQLMTTFALVCLAAFLAMAWRLLYVYYDRIHSVVLRDELSHLDYLGFDYLDVSSAMDEVVGKYAEEVGFWKERLKL